MQIGVEDLIEYRDMINKMIDRFPTLPGDEFLYVDWIKVNEGDVIPNESGNGMVEVCVDVIKILLDAANDEMDERISGKKKPMSPRNCKKKTGHVSVADKPESDDYRGNILRVPPDVPVISLISPVPMAETIMAKGFTPPTNPAIPAKATFSYKKKSV